MKVLRIVSIVWMVGAGALHAQTTTITGVAPAAGNNGAICPGDQATISGTNLGGAAAVVTVGTKQAYVIASSGSTFLTIEIPIDAPTGATTIKVGSSAASNISLVPYAPALPIVFSNNAPSTLPVAYHLSADLTSAIPVTASYPAAPGELLGLIAFGLGQTNPVVPTGSSAPNSPKANTVAQPAVSVGGKPATGVTAYATPGQTASYLVVFNVPAALTTGSQPITVSIGGSTSSPLNLPVSTAPIISQVLNGASYNAAGLPNSPIAQGAIFVIKGGQLGPATLLISSNAFQSTQLSGTSVSITVNGTTVAAPMYYTWTSQVAALLPSNTPTGTGTVTVTYNGQTSPPAPITVVPNNLGIFTITSDGQGAGIVMYGDYSLVSDTSFPNCGGANTFCGAANPNDTLILWATGLGPVNGSDAAGAGLGVNMPNVPLTLWVGGVQANVVYQGRSGYIGEDQINFTVPAGAPTGCAVPLVAQIGNMVSNTVVMPIAPAGSRTCVPANPALVSSVAALTGAAPVNYGSISMKRQDNYPGFQDTLKGQFARFNVPAPLQPFAVSYLDVPPLGTCMVFPSTSTGLTPPFASVTALDAGSQLSVTGPNGSKTIAGSGGSFSGTLSGGGNFLSPGSYTIAVQGGMDVFAIAANYVIPGMPAMTSPQPDSINPTSVTRSNGMTVTWAEGTSDILIDLQGSSATDNTNNVGASFQCTASGSDAKLTVPPYVLLALPAGGFGGINFRPAAVPAVVPSMGLGLMFISAQYDFFSPVNWK